MSDSDSTYIANHSEEDEEFDEDDEQSYSLSQGDFENPNEGYSSVEEDCGEYEDYNHLFVTDQLFESREEAFDWLRVVGKDYYMYFSVYTKCEGRSYIRCNRGREYRASATKDGAKPRKSSGSVMTKCPFQLVVEQIKWNRLWSIRTMTNHGKHNHALGKRHEGHRWPSALKPEEFEIVRLRSEFGIRPTKILEELKKNPEGNYCKLRHIYNARIKIKKEYMGEMPPFTFFFKLLADEGWYFTSQAIRGTNQLGDVFFAHRKSIELCKTFSQVFLIDATYKTNRWNLPLVEVIGVVPTGQNFHVAFAFIHNEKEYSYTWVFTQLEEILMGNKPRIVVTDRELASMNAVRAVFGEETTNLLCRRHIISDVQKNLTKFVKSKDKEKTLSGCWKAIVNALTLDAYELAVNDLCERFADYPRFVEYVYRIWLTPYREKFVAFWTDQHRHYGATTTNRVEGAHAQLKGDLQSNRGDLCHVWEDINRVVRRQLDTIAGAFEQSRSIIPHEAKKGIFAKLGGKTSHKAISLMYQQVDAEWKKNRSLCNCSLWTSHGLFCMCRILDCWEKEPKKHRIQVAEIDPFWTSLDLDDPHRDEEKATQEEDLDEAYQNFKDRACQFEMKKLAARLRNEPQECDDFVDYDEPPIPPQKGRPPKATGHRFKDFLEKGWRKKKTEKKNPDEQRTRREQPGRLSECPGGFLVQFPHVIREFVTGHFDVHPDGHCGYHVVSWFYWNGDQERHVAIRLMLKAELQNNYAFWWQYYGDEYPAYVERVSWTGPCLTNPYYWLSGLTMLPLVATCFQKIICLYAPQGSSMTFLPLRYDYDDGDGERSIVPPLPETWHMGFVNNNHFIVLNVRDDAPKPRIEPSWRRTRPANIKLWSRLLGCSKENWV